MRSMTGFGRCIMENELFTQQWEIRSVNGKRLDIKWTLPPSVANLENRFDKMVRKYAASGRVNIDLNLQFLAADPDLHFDKARARGMLASVVALAPAVLVFLSGQDYLEQGIVSTAVKE